MIGTDAQKQMVLQGLEIARGVFEQSRECLQTLVPIRNGAVHFDRQRVLGESANDYARAVSELKAQAVLLYGAQVFPGRDEPVYVHCQLSDRQGVILLFAKQALLSVDDANVAKWSEPDLNCGPFPFKGQGWIPQE